EAAGGVCGADDRRFGLRATESGGDGSAVHPLGGALRAEQRHADEQLTVLAVGANLQRPDDDSGRDRPAGASKRNNRMEPAELPSGASQEGEATRQPGRREGKLSDGTEAERAR